MDVGHSWRIVTQTDVQGLKKKQCSLEDCTRHVNEFDLTHHGACTLALSAVATQNGSSVFYM